MICPSKTCGHISSQKLISIFACGCIIGGVKFTYNNGNPLL
jgi:hypothetical protein